MSDLDQFYQNCAEVRSRIAEDAALQERIREVMDKQLYPYHGESARYASLEGTGIGIKRRTTLSYDPEIELVVTAHLWAPAIPVSRFIVVVRQEDCTMFNKGKDEAYKALTYVVEDFGLVVKGHHPDGERIREHANGRGVDLSRSAIGYKKDIGECVVYDLDPGASFTGDFDRVAWKLLRGSEPAYKHFRDIRDKLFSPEFTLTL